LIPEFFTKETPRRSLQIWISTQETQMGLPYLDFH